ncbi:MAG: ABC transporter substrate-binding protein [Chloroflexota bacterium]
MRKAMLLLVASLLASACSAPVPAPTVPATRPAGVDVVRIAWTDAGVLTPFRVSTLGPGGPVLLMLVYDSLVWKDEHGLIPWLASRCETSPDGREVTFTLVDNVAWHDGQPLTTDDVAFSFDYYAQHPYRWQSTDIVESATAVDAHHVRIRLKQPFAPFVEDIAGIVPIIPHHVWSQVADPERYDGPDATVGSGPFKLAEYRPADAAYRLIANPTYFHGQAAVREIQQLNVPPETRIQALQQHQLELVQSSDASVKDLVAADPRLRVLETPPLSIVRLAINTARPPLDRLEVRQALAYALDRGRIAELLTKAPPSVGSAGVIPPETPWFDPSLPAYGFDPERARALLGGQTLSLELLADPGYREPELMQPMLQAVGISLNIKRVDPTTRTALLREGAFQLAEVQHLGVGGDPDFLRRWAEGVESNDFAQGWTFADPEFTDVARQQAVTLDPVRRKELVFRMQEILASQLPTITLYYRRFYWVYDGQSLTPMNTWGGLMNALPFVQNKLAFLRR